MTAKSIPEGYHSLTPNLTVDNGPEALTFYENGFGADVLRKHVIGSKLMHAESGRLASASRPYGQRAAAGRMPADCSIRPEAAVLTRALARRRGCRINHPPIRCVDL